MSDRKVVGFDPGTARAGLAVVLGGVLLEADEFIASTGEEMISRLLYHLRHRGHGHGAVLVSEWPVKYPNRRATWGTIEAMRNVVRAVEKGLPWAATERFTPARWSGTVPKNIRNLRVGEALTAEERERWAPMGLDGKDAVAIAKWYARKAQ